MGQHAIDAIAMCVDHESRWDDYFNGYMSNQDAFDAGITDASGFADSEQLERVSARNPIPTLDNLNNELSHAMKDLEIATLRSRVKSERVENTKKPNPTCNCCGCQMQPREGKFGKFYYCECPDQSTVSDKYWQEFKAKHNKG